MNKARLENDVIEIIKQQVGVDRSVNLTDSLTADLDFDELDHIEVILELEDGFDIVISDEEGDESRLRTVADVVALVAKKLGVD